MNCSQAEARSSILGIVLHSPAAEGYGLATNHPYQDGNKRIAFLAMVIFLGLNGWDFVAPEVEVVSMMLAVAAGRCSEPELAEWIRKHRVPLS